MSVSSIPTTATSSGTVMPRRRSTLIAATASRSLAQTIASGVAWASSASIAGTAAAYVKSARLDLHVGRASAARGGRECSTKPRSRAAPGTVSIGPLTKAMWRRPVRGEVVEGEPDARGASRRARCRCRRCGGSEPMTTTGGGWRSRASSSSVGDPQRAEDQPVAVAAVEVAEETELVVGVGAGGGDDEAASRRRRARRRWRASSRRTPGCRRRRRRGRPGRCARP